MGFPSSNMPYTSAHKRDIEVLVGFAVGKYISTQLIKCKLSSIASCNPVTLDYFIDSSKLSRFITYRCLMLSDEVRVLEPYDFRKILKTREPREMAEDELNYIIYDDVASIDRHEFENWFDAAVDKRSSDLVL